MKRAGVAGLVSLVAVVSLWVVACGAPAAAPPVTVTVPPTAFGASPGMAVDPPSSSVLVDETGDQGPIPVTSADPVRGDRGAPVTIVEFADFQCPYSRKVKATLDQLLRDYGPRRLRLAWKNDPLPFHALAQPSSVVATLLFQTRGPDAFWRAYDDFYSDQEHLADRLSAAASLAGGSVEDLKGTPAWDPAEAKVKSDLALAGKIGASGTPTFFINGVLLSGAQPIDKFTKIIDEQLVKADEAIAHGTPPGRVYVELSKAQFAPPSAKPVPDPMPEDTRPHRVPIAGSPVRGKPTALVTLVMFTDFQCPFCGRVAATLRDLEQAYGDKLRIVVKHEPLPFHPRAEPAAELALEARAQKGDRGFWDAYDLLYAKTCVGSPTSTTRDACMSAGGTWEDHQQRLADADLEAYAKTLGLSVPRVVAAITSHKHRATIQADADLADDVQASGTPHFFINGRRLVGAQPIEKFKAVIDEELAKAEELVHGGVPAEKVYDKLQETAVGPAAPERVHVPAPTLANPSRGPAGAKVVIQMFADFQCPFCQRALTTIAELEKAYPGKIRVVWRNQPLVFHANAELAAEAALEAFKQRGAAGFWAMHDKLYANQRDLDRAHLEGYAADLGLDPARFAAALDGSTHQAEIEADKKIANNAGIKGTPTFVVNDYLVVGAQPITKFRRFVDRILSGR